MKLRILLLAALFALSACSSVIHAIKGEESHAPAKPAYTVMAVVHFATNSSSLNSASRAILRNAAASLNRDSALQVEVAGHADSRNTDEYNMKLAERRAASVQKYLVKKGVDANRLTIRSYGESQPVAGNDTKEGMAKNRRVELRAR